MYDFILCPFCGNKTEGPYGFSVMEETTDDGRRRCWVKCVKCDAQGPKVRVHGNTSTGTMIRKSVDAWNIRHRIDNETKMPHAAHSIPRDSMGAKKFKEV
jgi:hypothetical protein